ncbi:MAG TPA: right-handed parallel beta-helix repeat-containing protein [Verrucomicrobiota bacterium]|nr:right-handed parallel beta-helix repeat-containing protein [Verrucomicrobiota bacterium]HNU50840.1 right-handed parallel beta-helix repeat-containing protein [Verrucomicrobiota bacterium]
MKADRPTDDYEKGIAVMADDVLVEGFDISGFWSGIYGGLGFPVQGGHIVRNLIHGCVSEGITMSGSRDYEIGHNTVEGTPTGIMLNGANTRVHIHNNRVTASRGDGIRLWLSPGCVVDHNVCEDNAWDGIYLAQSPECTADHNRACNNGWNGIEVGNSPDCTVTGNETCGNRSGITVGGSCGTRFERNLAAGNGGWDLFAVDWDGCDPTCNWYFNNRADTAYPSLELWDVKVP